MSLEIEKKKNAQENSLQKSKGVNSALWLVAILIVAVAAIGNVYLTEQFTTPVRVVGVVVLVLIALVIAAMTNQGKKFINFFKESKVELRKIVWPTRQESTQTTLIVMAVTVITSLILWGLDSVIVMLINFLTSLRF